MTGADDMAIIGLHRSDVKRYGAIPAIVLQQIRHYLDHQGGEWFEQKNEELARICGLSGDQVRRGVRRLEEMGALESARRRARFGDQTLSFRLVSVGEIANSEVAKSPDRTGGEIANCSSSSERVFSNDPPTPTGGDHQAGLFAVDNGDPNQAKLDTTAAFDRWWDNYPRGKRGSRSAAAAKFASLIRRGASVAELDARLSNYALGRSLAAKTYGGEAPVMHASRFLNRDHMDWIEPVTGPDDERVTYWEYACQKAAAAGGGSINALDPDAAFAIAQAAFLAAQSSTDPVTECERILTASGHERLWHALQRCWPEMTKFGAKQAFTAHLTTIASAA